MAAPLGLLFFNLKQSFYQSIKQRWYIYDRAFPLRKSLSYLHCIQHYYTIWNISDNENCKIYFIILGTMTDLSLKMSTLEADYQNFKSSEVRITLLLNWHFLIYFQMWNDTRLISIVIFQHLYSLKQAKFVVKYELEMRPVPPHIPWNLDTGLNSMLCWPYWSHLLQKINFIRVAHQTWVFTPHFNVINRSWKWTFHCFRPETRELSARLTTIQRLPALAQPDHQVCLFLTIHCSTKTFIGIKICEIWTSKLWTLTLTKIILQIVPFDWQQPTT